MIDIEPTTKAKQEKRQLRRVRKAGVNNARRMTMDDMAKLIAQAFRRRKGMALVGFSPSEAYRGLRTA